MSEANAKVPVSVYAEMTPNPAVLKFVANKRLIQQDSLEYTNIEEAQPSPLAVQLFQLPFVKQVFISANYVAITKYDIVEWDEVTLEVRELVRDYLAEGHPVLKPEAEAAASASSSESQANNIPNPESQIHQEEKPQEKWDDVDRKISELLEEYVLPAVSADGGNIKYLDTQDGVVKVLLQGACSGCPSSTMTLKQGIENLLNQMMPGQIKSVEAVNG